MNRFLSHNLWSTISKEAKNSTKRAAIAYVTSDEFIQFGEGDLLICDASPNAIKSAQTKASVLKQAFDRGATLYSLPGLHAKVILLNEKALIGSANASGASANTLVEAGLWTDQPTIVAQANAFIGQLASQATLLTERRLNHLLEIKVTQRPLYKGTSRAPVKTKVGGHRTWIIPTTEDSTDRPEDQSVVKATAESCRGRLNNPRSTVLALRWTGRSRFRTLCQKGDWLIQMWTPEGRQLPAAVYERSPVLDRDDFDTATYFYYECFPKADQRTKRWVEFKKLAKRAGIKRTIARHSEIEITENQTDTLENLWKE